MSLENTLPLRIEKALDRTIEIDKSGGEKPIEIIGTDSTVSLALMLTQTQSLEIQQRANLVVVGSPKEAEELERHLCFFGQTENTFVLPAFDVSAYSGLYPNSRQISARVRWAFEAAAAKPGMVFIATPEALMQRSLPPKILKAHTLVFKKGGDLPSDLARALGRLGYQSVPVVEDEGTFAVRGGIVDIYSPAHARPVRVELFGDTIESIRFFDPETQRSEGVADQFSVIPPREILYDEENRQRAVKRFRANVEGRPVDAIDRDSVQSSLAQGQTFPGLDFLIGDFYETFAYPIEHFSSSVHAWYLNPIEIARTADQSLETLKKEFAAAGDQVIRPDVHELVRAFDQMPVQKIARSIELSKIEFQDSPFDAATASTHLPFPVLELKFPPPSSANPMDGLAAMLERVKAWKKSAMAVFVSAGTQAQTQRLTSLFERGDLRGIAIGEDNYDLASWVEQQAGDPSLVHIIPRTMSESLRFTDEGLVFSRDEDFFGKKTAPSLQTKRHAHRTHAYVVVRRFESRRRGRACPTWDWNLRRPQGHADRRSGCRVHHARVQRGRQALPADLPHQPDYEIFRTRRQRSDR